MKKTLIVAILALCAICVNAQKKALTLERGWYRSFFAGQKYHTYKYNAQWASVHYDCKADPKEFPKVRFEFDGEKPQDIGIVYDYKPSEDAPFDSIKTAYWMPSTTTGNTNITASFLPIHKYIGGVSLFAFKPNAGTVRVKKVVIIDTKGKETELEPVANEFFGMVEEIIPDRTSGTVLFDTQYQSVTLKGVEGRKGAKITIKLKDKLTQAYQVGLIYPGENGGEDRTKYIDLEKGIKTVTVTSEADTELKGAFFQIKEKQFPLQRVTIKGAFVE